jgi:ABC-type glycerol-3-phosphate transport system permease component
MLLLVLPLLWAVAGSLLPSATPTGDVSFEQLSFQSYYKLFRDLGLLRPIVNSLWVATCTSLLAVVFGALSAYALCRLTFPGRRLVAAAILCVAMFPQMALVSPIYLILREVGLISTVPGLILPYFTFAAPLSVYLLKNHFSQLPERIEEAAQLDGASRLRVLWHVVIPASLPALMTAFVLTFLYCYNEFLFALSLTVGQEDQTVPVAIALMRGRYLVPWSEILAAAIVTTAPVLLIVIFLTQRVVAGLQATGVGASRPTLAARLSPPPD